MSWRKLSDDGDELCRSIDNVLDGIHALKDSVQKGQRVDGRGDLRMDYGVLSSQGASPVLGMFEPTSDDTLKQQLFYRHLC